MHITYSKMLIDRREYCQGTPNAIEITENEFDILFTCRSL